MASPLLPEFYGVYSAEHHNRDYYADVGQEAVFVHKKELGRTTDEWVTYAMIGDATKNARGDWEVPIKTFSTDPPATLAKGQTSLEFQPTGGLLTKILMGRSNVAFTIQITELVDPNKLNGGFTTYTLTFEMFQSEASNSAYASPPSTDKSTGTPIPYSMDTFTPGVAKKLVGDFNATDSSADATTTTTNTPLLLGVALLVVAVGFYGMQGKKRR